MNGLYVLSGIIGLIVAFVWYVYNNLVVLRVRIKEAWSGIDVQLKRRSDLIPNIVETVKGYAKHEKDVFKTVTEARSALMNAKTPHQAAAADNMLTGALKSLFAVAEAYPELKASDNFRDLQRQLEDTEDKVAYSRQFYNGQVLSFNTMIQMFPHVLIANMFGFKAEEFFEANDEERKSVKVKFD
ncbi:MAG: LemA-like protein [uncultured bacterium]|nr:MAG: LemA-like protein [uncultured bacterium]